MTEAAPHPALAAAVRRYSSYAERTTGFTARRELPWAGVAMIIGFEGSIEIAYDDGTRLRRTSFVAALHDRPVTVDSGGAQRGVQVDLTPLGAQRLLGGRMDELANGVVALDDVLGPLADRLAERLEAEPDPLRRFALLDAVLVSRLAASRSTPPAVAWAWQRLCDSGGRVAVADLARETGFSRRHLTAGFTRHVGMPPRTLARILRFERFTTRLAVSGAPDWARLAADCGFYDQPHLNREVRALAGTTPTHLVASLLPDGGGLRA